MKTTNDATAKFRFEESDGRVRCFELVDGERGPEVGAGLNFHPSAWRQLVPAASLLLVEIPLCPLAEPEQLASLDDDDQLVLRDAVAEYDVLLSAGRVREQLAARMARAAAGRLSSREAAAWLAVATGGRKSTAHEQIVKAFVAGALVFRDTDGRFVAEAGRLDAWFADSGAKYVLAEIGGEISAYTTHEEMNKWLEREGHPDRIPDAASSAPIARATAKGPAKVWTEERKAEARAYREVHGLKKTAQYYGVSEATISRHIPAGKSASKLQQVWANVKKA